MKWIGYLFSSIWRLWFLIMFMLVFIIFMPALFFFTAIKKNQIAVAHLTRYWSKLTIWLSFIFPVLEWEEEINKKEKYIFCANHVSALDIPLVVPADNSIFVSISGTELLNPPPVLLFTTLSIVPSIILKLPV